MAIPASEAAPAESSSLDGLLRYSVGRGASDIILVAGCGLVLRVNGKLTQTKSPEFSDDEIRALLLPLLTAGRRKELDAERSVDFSFVRKGIGRFRTQENGLPIDSSGALTGSDVDGPFNGVAELSTKLAASQMVRACAVKHFFRFAMARPADAVDECVMKSWTSAFDRGGGKIQDLVSAYVADRAFATRKDDR